MSNLYLCFDADEKDRLVQNGCIIHRERMIGGRKCWELYSPDGSFERFIEKTSSIVPMQLMTF